MNARLPYRSLVISAGVLLAVLAFVRVSAGQVPRHDYLSNEEADKIRNASTPTERIKLYLSFAEDRLQKFDYEVHRTAPERNRSGILNGLLHGYSGCMDDISDQVDDAQQKQLGIRDALHLIKSKGKGFLTQLQKYEKKGPYLESYRDSLEDAIDGTKDTLSEAADAEKVMPPPPVRRRQ